MPGILIHIGGRAGKACGEHIDEAVFVEVVGPGEEVVWIGLAILRRGLVDELLCFAVRSGKPERPVNDIHVAIAVDISRMDALRVIAVRELDALEPMNLPLFRSSD